MVELFRYLRFLKLLRYELYLSRHSGIRLLLLAVMLASHCLWEMWEEQVMRSLLHTVYCVITIDFLFEFCPTL